MADSDPTGDGATVALNLPAGHVRFLRGVFEDAREGVSDDLANYPEELKDPVHLRGELVAYGRLLAALDELTIVPDAEVLAIVADLTQSIDGSNQYRRVVTEHEALHGLLAQLTGGR
jgi:hypothetical protein